MTPEEALKAARYHLDRGLGDLSSSSTGGKTYEEAVMLAARASASFAAGQLVLAIAAAERDEEGSES